MTELGTTCVQGGYHPGDAEPRQIPIYQSTTWKYDTSEHMGKLFDLEETGYFYSRLQNPTCDLVAACRAHSFWLYATPPAALLCPAFTRVSHARCALNFKANRRIRACFFICERFHSSRPAQTRYCAEFK